KLDPVYVTAAFDLQRSGQLAQLGRKLGRRKIHIHTNAERDMLDMVQFRGEFRQHTGDFPAVDEYVVGPFDLRRQTSLLADRPNERDGGGHRELRGSLGPQVGPEEDGKPQPTPGG